MTEWVQQFTELASGIEKQLDALTLAVKLRAGWLKPIEIEPYRGHGTAQVLYLKGRVLENKGIVGATKTDSVWQNVLNMYRRFNSDEIANARLRVHFQDQSFEAQTDDEGYFDLQIVPQQPLAMQRVWHKIGLELIAPKAEEQTRVRAVGHVMVPPDDAEFGIISDIDDTIVYTQATNAIAMARVVVLNNPHTRLPFEGVAAFYQALRKGSDGRGYNPVFYVSSSPWNLYDLLIDFLNIHGIPNGPLFLRDIGLEPKHVTQSGHHAHKLKQIRTIVETHPRLPFVLIGDSGQEDPEIYRQAIREHPGRIKAIYIRDVTAAKRDAMIREIAAEVRGAGIPFELVADTITAARHAVEQGLITADALPKIEADKHHDAQLPTLGEEVLGPLNPHE